MKVVKWFVLSVFAVGAVGAAIDAMDGKEPPRRPAPQGQQMTNSNVTTFDFIDEIHGGRIFGFTVTSNEDPDVSLAFANVDGEGAVVLADEGIRLWRNDKILSSDGKAVYFRSEAMPSPETLQMFLPEGKANSMQASVTAKEILQYTQGGTLYVRVQVPSETFSFDMRGNAIKNRLQAMGVTR